MRLISLSSLGTSKTVTFAISFTDTDKKVTVDGW